MLDYIILGSLTIRSMTGYEIKKLMSYSTAFFSNVSYGSIYPTLKRFEETGLVRSHLEQKGGRRKKVYEITDAGRELFTGWLSSPLKPLNFKYEILVRLFFARSMPHEQLLDLVEQHLEQIRQLSETLKLIHRGPAVDADEYQLLTLRFGLDFYRFLEEWFSQMLEQLKNGGFSPEPEKTAKSARSNRNDAKPRKVKEV